MIDWINQCHFGDCLETLKRMPDGIAQTCVTSPPYFGRELNPAYKTLQNERLIQPSFVFDEVPA